MQVDGFGAMIAIVFGARTQTLLVLESCTTRHVRPRWRQLWSLPCVFCRQICVFCRHGVIWLVDGVDVFAQFVFYRQVALLPGIGTWAGRAMVGRDHVRVALGSIGAAQVRHWTGLGSEPVVGRTNGGRSGGRCSQPRAVMRYWRWSSKSAAGEGRVESSAG